MHSEQDGRPGSPNTDRVPCSGHNRNPETFLQGATMAASASQAQSLPPPAIVMQMALGGWVARTISEISKLNVPDALAVNGPQTAAQLVAGGIAVNANALERALRACASVGLFVEDA